MIPIRRIFSAPIEFDGGRLFRRQQKRLHLMTVTIRLRYRSTHEYLMCSIPTPRHRIQPPDLIQIQPLAIVHDNHYANTTINTSCAPAI